MYIYMLELLKEYYKQEMFGTSMPYNACERYVWYFMQHDMMNDENISCKLCMR